MTLKIKNIEKTYISKEIEYCCEDMSDAIQGRIIYTLIKDNKIETFLQNKYYICYLKYCPFCGEKLQDEK